MSLAARTPSKPRTDSPEDCRATLADIARWEDAIQSAAARFRIDPADIRAIIGVESHARPGAHASTSRASAHGLMQVTAGTWKDMQDRYHDLKPYDFDRYWQDPKINILFGAATLAAKRDALQRMGVAISGPNFAELAVTAYNGGEGTVKLAYQHAKQAGSRQPEVDLLQFEHMAYGVDHSTDQIWRYYMPGHGGGRSNKSGTREEAVRLKTHEVLRYAPRIAAYLAEEQREGLTSRGSAPSSPSPSPSPSPSGPAEAAAPAPLPQSGSPKPAADDAGVAAPAGLAPARPGHLISSSVGRGGVNRPSDVGAIQEALRAHGEDPGDIDHKIGPHTITAIESFQHHFLHEPDGRVDVGRVTERHLLEHPSKAPSAAPRSSPDTPAPAQPRRAPADRQPQAEPPQRRGKNGMYAVGGYPSSRPAGTKHPPYAGSIVQASIPGLPVNSSHVKLTPPIVHAATLLAPYLPRGTRITSGWRTDEDQARLIVEFAGGLVDNDLARAFAVASQRKLISWVGNSNHRPGHAMDLSGASLSQIEAAVVRCRAEHPDAHILGTIFEGHNNCIHVNVAG